MLHLNQIERQKKERATERGIEQEGQKIGSGKRAISEESERQHGMCALRFLDKEEREKNDAGGEGKANR